MRWIMKSCCVYTTQASDLSKKISMEIKTKQKNVLFFTHIHTHPYIHAYMHILIWFLDKLFACAAYRNMNTFPNNCLEKVLLKATSAHFNNNHKLVMYLFQAAFNTYRKY